MYRKPRRYIFGCSNVCRNYDKNCKVHTDYTLKRALNLSMLETELSKFRDNGASIVIAMVENVIQDELAKATDVGEALEFGKAAIARFYSIIEQESVKFPNSPIGVVKPTLRPGVKYYNQFMAEWEHHFEDQSKCLAMTSRQVVCVDTVSKQMQKFEMDGVHLNMASGRL